MSSTLQDSGYGVRIGRLPVHHKCDSLVLEKYRRDEIYFGKLISVNGLCVSDSSVLKDSDKRVFLIKHR